ncbi:MAG: carboxypeptidase-like regulatory domain-containing protein [Desulfobacterales bacterium]|nr:carboxypeptidase-like regulatory domain-containing protein [Desulfobacterales bacterium]
MKCLINIYAKPFFAGILMIVLPALIFVSCGDDNNPATTQTVQGVAATGAPMANAQVTLVDSKGTRITATTDSQGRYTIQKSGLTPPFAVEVTNDQGETFHALAFAYGRINITPLTEILTSMMVSGNSPATIMENLANVTKEQLTQAKSQLVDNLSPLLEAFGAEDTDLITGSFEANSKGIDALLDLITVTFDPDSKELTLSASGQTLFEAQISDSGMTPTTTLSSATLLTIPQLATKLFGDYHVVDFNADTSDETSEINWGEAQFTADGMANLTFSHSNGGEPGSETHNYTLQSTGALKIGDETGVQGACTTDKSFMALADTSTQDQDTGIVFFIKKSETAPTLEGQYHRLEFTRNNTGIYETDSWSSDFEFTWNQENQSASYVDEGETLSVAFNSKGFFEGASGLRVYPALNGSLLIIPHATPDDAGLTLMIKKPVSPYPNFDTTNGNTNDKNFTAPGFAIDTEENSFTAEKGTLAWTKTSSTLGVFNFNEEGNRTLQSQNGVFQFSQGGQAVSGEFGLYPSSGVLVWVDEKESDQDTDFGCHVAIETWPEAP